jgi:hypothetical protein
MMLIVKIKNDATGTNESANYDYVVEVNFKEIAKGRLEGHDRNDGWAVLLMNIAEQHLPKFEMPIYDVG